MKADHDKVKSLLKTARGQIDGLIKMVDDDRYCMEISHQLLAAQAILRKADREVVKAHLQSCVREAFAEGKEEEKIDEIINLVEKLTK